MPYTDFDVVFNSRYRFRARRCFEIYLDEWDIEKEITPFGQGIRVIILDDIPIMEHMTIIIEDHLRRPRRLLLQQQAIPDQSI